MPTSPPTLQMLRSKMLLNTSLVESWLPVISYLLPLTSGLLNDQLEDLQTQITTLLAQNIPVTQAIGTIIVPFTLVQNIQNTLNNFQNVSGGGVPIPSYANTRSQVNSILDQCAIRFWNTSIPDQVFVLAGADEVAE